MKILVVDDDEVTRKLLAEVLSREGYDVALASCGEAALQNLRKGSFPLVLSDIRMIEVSGMGVLREARKTSPDSVVILMTGFGSMEGALEAIREGAFDYVSKPFKLDELKNIVSRARKHWESLQLRSSGKSSGSGEKMDLSSTRTIIGNSPQIVDVYKTVARAAISNSNVLVTGESGTGKQLVAHAIHEHSPRRSGPFVIASCAEPDLFAGLFQVAEKGSLFLDEIADLPPSIQLKLFRMVQDAEDRGADIRILAATRKAPEDLTRAGGFRDDLFYKLNVISIGLPPLRERIEDLPDLVGWFLARHAEKNKKAVSHLSEEAMALLRGWSWPGNIRELEHVIERAVALTNMAVLYPEDFPDILAQASASASRTVVPSTVSSLEQMERTHILKVLEETSFNKSRASEVLGIDRATLYRKAQRYGIDLRGK